MSNRITFKKFILLFGDIFLLYVSLFGTVFFGFINEFSLEIFRLHLASFSIVYFFWLLIFYIFGLYDLHLAKSRLYFYTRSFGAMLAGLILGMLFFYTIPFFGITPKTNLILNSLIFGVLFLGWRKIFYSLFSVHFLNRIAIIGENDLVENFKKEIAEKPYLGHKLIQIDLNDNLLSQIKKRNINTVVFTEDLESDPRVLKALYLSSSRNINFLDFNTAYELIYEKLSLSRVSHAWFLENLREGERMLYDKIKRFLDVILASLMLIFTLPIWILIAIFIFLEDRNTVFYHQKRVGKNRKTFTLYKFRSMKIDAEKDGAVWAEEKDDRITSIGKILRRTHLDELPQMINVIRGDISMVGPRPERPVFVQGLEKEIPHYHLRHIIKPGFTGWAQLKFRYARSIMDTREKLQYDLYYLKNRSLLLDIGILLRTAKLLFKA